MSLGSKRLTTEVSRPWR